MKNIIRIGFTAAGIVSIMMATSASAAVFTIDDAFDHNGIYWGGYGDGTTHYSAPMDIAGNVHNYEISRMDVNTSNTEMTIDIHSRFLDNIGHNGVELGDLFLSNDGWNPNANGINYQEDYALNGGEAWEYALILDSHDPAAGVTSGIISLYNVLTPSILYAEDMGLAGFVRTGQEVQYNAGNQLAIATGTWEIFNLGGVDTDDYLHFTFNYDLASLGLVDDIGLHWGMTCGNDVVEGGHNPVPEPATMLLFGTGLVGFLGMRRKGKKR